MAVKNAVDMETSASNASQTMSSDLIRKSATTAPKSTIDTVLNVPARSALNAEEITILQHGTLAGSNHGFYL